MQIKNKKIDYWKLEAWLNLIAPLVIVLGLLLLKWLLPVIREFRHR